jgi:hypothetical protein
MFVDMAIEEYMDPNETSQIIMNLEAWYTYPNAQYPLEVMGTTS